MAYDVYYFNPNGSPQAGYDRCVDDYDTPHRRKMLTDLHEYAEACQLDHPARPWVHWNGRAWVDGPFDPAIAKRKP